MLGDLLGNSYFVERMGARNESAWKRFILALKAADDGRAAGISKEAQKYLSGLYKSYVKAVDNAGRGVNVTSMVDEGEKEKAADTEKGVDSDSNERYNKRVNAKKREKITKYISSDKIPVKDRVYIQRALEAFFEGEAGIVNGIAVEVGNMVYVVDSGCEDGDVNYAVIKRRNFQGQEEVKEKTIRRINDNVLSKSHVSPGLRERVGRGVGGNFGSDVQRSPGTELRTHTEKPENNGSRTSEQAAGDGRVSNERKSKQTQTKKVIDLSNDDRLSALVEGVHGSQRYNIIREYILAELADQPIRLSDGKMAVVDNRDAQHMSRGAGTKKTAAISHIKEIVESAALIAEEESAKENKFSHFWYYKADALYEGEPVSLYVNVGQARNDASYHVYDLTKKLRDTAHRVYDVGRPVGNAILNGISDNSIPQNSEKSTANPKKISDERKSKKVYRRAETALAEFGVTSDFARAGLESDAKTKKDEKGCLP